MTKRIIKLDASSLVKSSCDLRFYNIVIKGYREPLVSNDIQYGTAVHKFVETMFRSDGKLDLAINAAKEIHSRPCLIKLTKKHLTLNHLMRTCIDLWQDFIEKDDFEYFTLTNGQPAVEITFSIKIYEDEENEVYLEGTIDKFGKIKNGCYAVGDYKTTSSWDTDSYFNGYRLSPQLKTYVYAIKTKASTETAFSKIAETPIGAFIDGIFLSSSKPSTFKRSEVFVFKDKQLATYEKMLINTAKKVCTWVNEPEANGLINGSCMERFGPCRFFNICAAPDKITQEQLLKRDFIVKPYEPLKFGEI